MIQTINEKDLVDEAYLHGADLPWPTMTTLYRLLETLNNAIHRKTHLEQEKQ